MKTMKRISFYFHKFHPELVEWIKPLEVWEVETDFPSSSEEVATVQGNPADYRSYRRTWHR